MRRYILLAALIAAAVLVPGLVHRTGGPAAAPPPARMDVPQEALDALKAGRYWRASRILRDYLAATPKPDPDAVLLTARAEAGWGAWDRVEALLRGQSWLDQVDAGAGWALLGRSRFERGEWASSDVALRNFLAVSADAGDRERGLAMTRRGLALAQLDSTRAALAAYDSALVLLPQLSDWIQLYAARAAASGGDTAAVARRLAATADDLARRSGWILRVRAMQKTDDDAGAIAATRSAVDRLDDSPSDQAGALNLLGDLLLQRRDTAGAAAAYRRAMRASPSSVGGIDGARKLTDLPGVTARDQLAIGRLYARAGNTTRAIRGLRAFLESGQGSTAENADVRAELAREYFRAGDYTEAVKRLDAVATAASGETAARAAYDAARARYRSGHRDEAVSSLKALAARYPGEPSSTRALFLVADLAHDLGAVDTARSYYHRAIASNDDQNEAGLAMMRLADLAIVGGDWSRAADVFEDYRSRHPGGRRIQQATYWAGRAYAELGEPDSARIRMRQAWSLDPLSYYGMRAGEQLGLGIDDVPMEPSPAPSDSLAGEVGRALYRLDLLRELSDDDAADTEIGRIRRAFEADDGAEYLLAEALNARGFTVAGIRLGWRIRQDEGAWNPRLLRIIYPFPYENIVLAEAGDRGVDPFLVAGLVRQESMFSAGAVSGAGAIGLMQVMPKTGVILARASGVQSFHASMLKQPEINIHLGIRYLKDMLDTYDGILPAVLSAYNAGPTRVERWQEFPEWNDAELFTERIPYTETRDYVKVVQENTRMYRLLYAGPSPSE